MHQDDYSYGILPLRQIKGEWQILLIKHLKGHWAFPKGHADPDEKPIEAAMRELKEETGLIISRFLERAPFQESYVFRSGQLSIHKTVIYFAAEVEGDIMLQEEEIEDYKWLSVRSAHKYLTFPEARRVCEEINVYLSEEIS